MRIGSGIARSLTWVGCIVLSFLAFGAAPASPSGCSTTLPGAGVTAFADIPPGYWAGDFISRVSRAGVMGGCSEMAFCPDSLVSRQDMAVYLIQGLIHRDPGHPSLALSSPQGQFQDVPATDCVARWVEALAGTGITAGCGGGNFCPCANLTRAQMAVFLVRSKYYPDSAPLQAYQGMFQDVPADYWAAQWIEQLAREQITAGCSTNPPLFCPEGLVSRAQMAVFLVRTFSLP